MKKGFTLAELLATLVILSILALVVVPSVLSLIEDSKRKTFIESAKNTINAAMLYNENNGIIEPNGTNIRDLDINKKETVSGLVYYTKNNQYYLRNFTNKVFCANGTKNNLVVKKKDCSNAPLDSELEIKTTRARDKTWV